MSIRQLYSNKQRITPQELAYGAFACAAAYQSAGTVGSPLLEALGVVSYLRAEMAAQWNPHVSLFTHPEGMTVAVEGTSNLRQWLQNIMNAGLTALTPLPGRVMGVLNLVADGVVPWVQDKATPSTPLFLTGHSLGGGAAVVAAYRLQKAGYNVKNVVTFGAPKIGNVAFAGSYNIPTAAVQLEGDSIVAMPPSNVRFWSPASALTGFPGDSQHVGDVYAFGSSSLVQGAREIAAGLRSFLLGGDTTFTTRHTLDKYAQEIVRFTPLEKAENLEIKEALGYLAANGYL